MFDIGFSEIVVIAVVALVVIGPERLPKTARTLGLLFGRLQRYVNDVKSDIRREMELDELRGLQREIQGAAREFEQSVKTAADDVSTGVRRVEHELNSAGAEATRDNATPGSSPAAPLASPDDSAPPRQAPLPGFDKI
ncbi:MAG TPA: Sec-independent protein translocase protein TatB [Casimicrobiaceae bacterium]|nr:Sec-independent protein translocase protein TatB [Casimicrobiaceae bacterium]